MKITRELIEELKTRKGGWRHKDLVWLGVEFDSNGHPISGWKFRLEKMADEGRHLETIGPRPPKQSFFDL